MDQQERPGRRGEFAVDPAKFAELFFDIPLNRDQIWTDMAKIVVHVARGVATRSASDMEEFKGDAHLYAMSKLRKYTPRKKTAYFFFYKLIRRRMRFLASKESPVHLGEHDIELSMDSIQEASCEGDMKVFRANNPKTWRSFRLQNRQDRERFRRWVRVTTQRAIAELHDDPTIKLRVALIVETLHQGSRALLGERPIAPKVLARE
jgi:hypothetical protein